MPGRAPVQQFPGMAPSPLQGPPSFVQQPMHPPGWTPPQPLAPVGQAFEQPRPIFRGAAPDSPPIVRGAAPEVPLPFAESGPTPAALMLPSPELLGVGNARNLPVEEGQTTAVDWNATRNRLRRLGAITFQVSRLTQGGYRVTFLLPTTEQDSTHQVEAVAGSEAVAVAVALERAEQWAGLSR